MRGTQSCSSDFNPRSREGSDVYSDALDAEQTGISIHAPAKGATFTVMRSMPNRREFQSTLPRRERQTHPADYRLVRNFNPRSREGSDGHPSRRLRYPPYFNPRSREGSDYEREVVAKSNSYFNPRSREGSDPEPQHTAAEIHISIHAPAKGATGYDLAPLGRNAISIHAPAKGATTKAASADK